MTVVYEHASRFDAVFGASRRVRRPGVLDATAPAMRVVSDLTARAEAGDPEPLWAAFAAHHDDPDIVPAVRAALADSAVHHLTTAIRVRAWPLPRQVFGALNLLQPTPDEDAHFAKLIADWVDEGALRLGESVRPQTWEEARAEADSLGANAVCDLLAARCVADPENVLLRALPAEGVREWWSLDGGWPAICDWLGRLSEYEFRQVFSRALVRGNIYMCPEPIRVDDFGDADARRAALHGELKALNASGAGY